MAGQGRLSEDVTRSLRLLERSIKKVNSDRRNFKSHICFENKRQLSSRDEGGREM